MESSLKLTSLTDLKWQQLCKDSKPCRNNHTSKKQIVDDPSHPLSYMSEEQYNLTVMKPIFASPFDSFEFSRDFSCKPLHFWGEHMLKSTIWRKNLDIDALSEVILRGHKCDGAIKFGKSVITELISGVAGAQRRKIFQNKPGMNIKFLAR